MKRIISLFGLAFGLTAFGFAQDAIEGSKVQDVQKEEKIEAQENQISEKKDEEASPYSEVGKYLHFGLNSRRSFFNPESEHKIISLGIFTANDNFVTGFQESLFHNETKGLMTGYQASIGSNAAFGGFRGYQQSCFSNFALENSFGAQASWVCNIAQNLTGAQLALGFNIAEEVTGTQISWGFNAAKKVRGAQIAFVNFAEDSSWTLGLINIVKNGVHDFGISYDSDKNLWFTIQEGSRNLYTSFGGGFNPSDLHYVSLYAGLGTRQSIKNFSFDTEILWKYVFCGRVKSIGKEIHDIHEKYDGLDNLPPDEDKKLHNLIDEFAEYQIPSLKFTANYEIFKHLSVFGAVACDLRVEDWNDSAFKVYRHNLNGSVNFGDTKVTFHPTFSFGLKIK